MTFQKSPKNQLKTKNFKKRSRLQLQLQLRLQLRMSYRMWTSIVVVVFVMISTLLRSVQMQHGPWQMLLLNKRF